MSSQKDFSLFSLFAAGLACMIPFASAYTQPTGDAPEGNPISQPGLNSVVPVGSGFSVTWQPTTDGTVTLVLLKGPSSNAVPQYAIAEKIKNSGTYVWTPATDLAPSEDATGYGIQLIVDATGQYQYTTQFGISNPDYSASSSSSSSSSSASASASSSSSEAHGHGHQSASWTATASDDNSWVTVTATHSATAIVHWGANDTYTITKAPSTATTSLAPIGTGIASGGIQNVTMVAPTGSMTVPATLQTSKTSAAATGTSATASPSAQANSAASMATSFAGLVFAAGVAVFAL